MNTTALIAGFACTLLAVTDPPSLKQASPMRVETHTEIQWCVSDWVWKVMRLTITKVDGKIAGAPETEELWSRIRPRPEPEPPPETGPH